MLRMTIALVGLVVACRPPSVDKPASPAPAPVVDGLAKAGPAVVAPNGSTTLYPVDEAIADALSKPLRFVGIGGRHGLFMLMSCTYTNDVVLVVDTYCTKREMKSFGVVIYSPTRGQVEVYAEAKAPISKLKKSDYSTFFATSRTPEAPHPSLTMSHAELDAYDKSKASSRRNFCDEGIQNLNPSGGCHPQSDLHAAFAERNAPFMKEPTAAWYQLVNSLIAARQTNPSKITPENLEAWGQMTARHEKTNVYSYWEKYVGNSEGHFAPVIATAEGGLILVGTKSPGASRSQAWAIQLDASGTVRWRKNLGRRGFPDFEGAGAIVVPDGVVVYVLAYAIPGQGATSRLVKLDTNGKVIWDWVGRGRGSVGTPFATNVWHRPDGTFLLTGHIYLVKGGPTTPWRGVVDAKGQLVSDEVGAAPAPP